MSQLIFSLLPALGLLSVAQVPSRPSSEADRAFEDGRRLLKAGNTAEACPAFERSHRLDPALGTLLNLAECYQKSGRWVRAWTLFNEAGNWAASTREAKREKVAQKRGTF